MKIRLANENDLNQIMNIVDQAKIYMIKNKINQWTQDYPNEKVFLEDIKKERLYVLDDGKILGFSALILDGEPDYDYIEGNWISDKKYGVIHRIAVDSDYKSKNVAQSLLSFFEEKLKSLNFDSIRVDTHPDNKSMLRFIEKNGFTECGIVYIRKKDKRIAFEKKL